MTTNPSLRELAMRATKGPHHIYTHPRDDNNWKSNEEFIIACDPQTILAKLDEIDGLRAENARLLSALRLARDELAGLPHSLGYEFTHLPKIDKAIAAAREVLGRE